MYGRRNCCHRTLSNESTRMLQYRLCLVVAGLMLCVTALNAQEERSRAVRQGELAGSYPVPGSHLLQKQEAEARALLAANAGILESATLGKTAWAFTVGSTYTWYADDLSEELTFRYLVPSTCRAVGSHCYVFVEDAVWGTSVTQAGVDSVWDKDKIVIVLDHYSPAPLSHVFRYWYVYL